MQLCCCSAHIHATDVSQSACANDRSIPGQHELSQVLQAHVASTTQKADNHSDIRLCVHAVAISRTVGLTVSRSRAAGRSALRWGCRTHSVLYAEGRRAPRCLRSSRSCGSDEERVLSPSLPQGSDDHSQLTLHCSAAVTGPLFAHCISTPLHQGSIVLHAPALVARDCIWQHVLHIVE